MYRSVSRRSGDLAGTFLAGWPVTKVETAVFSCMNTVSRSRGSLPAPDQVHGPALSDLPPRLAAVGEQVGASPGAKGIEFTADGIAARIYGQHVPALPLVAR